MKITIEIDGVPIRETQVQELVGKIEQTECINVVCKPLPDGTLQSLVDGTICKPVGDQEQLPCKARRFLLVDEQANITECIKWGNGRVTNDGSGVQWVDQEVPE